MHAKMRLLFICAPCMCGPADRVLPSAMHAIHGTPAVLLSRLTSHFGVEGKIIAKLEYLSPGFSKKDRIARQMLEEAIEKSLEPIGVHWWGPHRLATRGSRVVHHGPALVVVGRKSPSACWQH